MPNFDRLRLATRAYLNAQNAFSGRTYHDYETVKGNLASKLMRLNFSLWGTRERLKQAIIHRHADQPDIVRIAEKICKIRTSNTYNLYRPGGIYSGWSGIITDALRLVGNFAIFIAGFFFTPRALDVDNQELHTAITNYINQFVQIKDNSDLGYPAYAQSKREYKAAIRELYDAGLTATQINAQIEDINSEDMIEAMRDRTDTVDQHLADRIISGRRETVTDWCDKFSYNQSFLTRFANSISAFQDSFFAAAPPPQQAQQPNIRQGLRQQA